MRISAVLLALAGSFGAALRAQTDTLNEVSSRKPGYNDGVVFELAPHTGFANGSGVFGLKLGMSYSAFSIELAGEQLIGKYANMYPVSVNAVLHLVTASRFIPYLTGGIGLLTTVPTTTLGDETVSSMGVNAGAGARLLVTKGFGLRAEFKHVMTNVKNKRDQTNRLVSFQQVTLGVSIFIR